METTTNTKTNETLRLPRSAGKLHTAAMDGGWTVEVADDENGVLHLDYSRNDTEQQMEANEALHVRHAHRAVASVKIRCDADTGSLWSASWADASGDWVNYTGGDESVSDIEQALKRPANSIAQAARKSNEDELFARKQKLHDEFVEQYRSDVLNGNDGYRWSHKLITSYSENEIVPADASDSYGDPSYYLRSAKQTAVQMILKSLATAALKRWGQPTAWDAETETFSGGTSMSAAVKLVSDEAFRNHSNRGIMDELQEAVSMLERGY